MYNGMALCIRSISQVTWNACTYKGTVCTCPWKALHSAIRLWNMIVFNYNNCCTKLMDFKRRWRYWAMIWKIDPEKIGKSSSCVWQINCTCCLWCIWLFLMCAQQFGFRWRTESEVVSGKGMTLTNINFILYIIFFNHCVKMWITRPFLWSEAKTLSAPLVTSCSTNPSLYFGIDATL